MRQIKFRGKDLKAGEWRYGFYTLGAFINPSTGAEVPRHLIDGDIYYDIDPETLGQFTGLTGLYDDDVYEGDIVFMDGEQELRAVVYYEQAFCLATAKELECLKKGAHPYLNDYAHMTCLNEWSNTGLVRVAGNIYDNPELLRRESPKAGQAEQPQHNPEAVKKIIEDAIGFRKLEKD